MPRTATRPAARAYAVVPPAILVAWSGGQGSARRAGLALVLPQVVVAVVVVARYWASGWSDGVESLAFLHPLGLGLLAALLLPAAAGSRGRGTRPTPSRPG